MKSPLTKIMSSILTLFATAALLGCSDDSTTPTSDSQGSSETPSNAGTIARLRPVVDELLAPQAEIERLATDFVFVEGPVWIDDAEEPHLLFSDIPANRVYRWSESAGVTTFIDPVMPEDAKTGGRGGSNGLALDGNGRLVLCEHGNRRVARLEDDGSRATVADSYQGKRLNSPNDIVFLESGDAYFTDPPYGLAEQDEDPNKEQPHNGIYRLSTTGEVELMFSGQRRPNGIGLSPDENTLYVANSDAEQRTWFAYPIEADGSLGAQEVLLDLTDAMDPGVPDGLAVDEVGNIWGTGPGGVVIISPSGEHLGTVRTAELPANVGFGSDGYLYITARTSLYRVKTQVSGS